MKKKIAMIAAAAICVICAAGCANGETQSQTGTVALGTTTPTAAASAEASTEAPATEQITSGTTTAASTEETDAAAGEAVAATGSLRENTRFTYRGVEFSVGDNADDVIPNLGDQSKPSDKQQPCIPGAGEIEYFYYDGVIIQVTQFGLICDINISKFETPDSDAATVTGVGMNTSEEECKSILGEPTNDYGGYFIYSDGGYSFSVIFDDEDGSVTSISASDMDLPM